MRLLAIWVDQRYSFKSAKKNIVISPIQNEILKQKSFTRSGFEGKLSKAFFLETIFMSKLRDTRGSNSVSSSSIGLKFGSFIAKYLKFKTLSVFFEI